MNQYFKKIGNTEKITSWESKGLSHEIIKPTSTSNNRLAPSLDYSINKTKVKFNGSCLKQNKITYTHGTIVNIYIVHKLSLNFNNFDFALENCFFETVKLTKNSDITNVLILQSANIQDIALDLMQKELFHFLVLELVKI